MTSYGAYDRDLPCRNTNCHSYGRPHPNCQCYSGLAEGGEVSRFCSETREHKEDCEYYADGGEVPEGYELDEDQSDIPAEAPQQQEEVPEGYELDEDQSGIDEAPEGYELDPDQSGLEEGSQSKALGIGLVKGLTGPFAAPILQGIQNASQFAASSGAPIPDLGLSDEEIKQSAEDYPSTQLAGEIAPLAAGIGVFGKLVRGAEIASMAPETIATLYPTLVKRGSQAIAGMINGGILQSSDDVTNWLLGTKEPNEPIGAYFSNIPYAMAVSGFAAPVIDKVASKLAQSEVGSKMASWLAGYGSDNMVKLAKNDLFDNQFYKMGFDAKEALPGALTTGVVRGTGVAAGYVGSNNLLGGFAGYYVAQKIKPMMNKILGRPIAATNDYVIAPMIKLMGSGLQTMKIPQLLNYGLQLGQGNSAADKVVQSAFDAIPQQLYNSSDMKINREKLRTYQNNGGIQQNMDRTIQDQNQNAMESQSFAEGGEVEPIHIVKNKKKVSPLIEDDDPIAMLYPDQNILMNAAKARISNYLTSIKPNKLVPKLAFDDGPDIRDQERQYDKALDLANYPLSIMDEITKGTIEPSHIQHIKSMHPEVLGLLQNKLIKKITQSQIEEKKPSFTIRQGLSLLMGTPLSGEFTQQNMMAAQMVFQNQQQSSQQGAAPQKKNKKNTSTLTKVAGQFQTQNQAASTRQQNK